MLVGDNDDDDYDDDDNDDDEDGEDFLYDYSGNMKNISLIQNE